LSGFGAVSVEECFRGFGTFAKEPRRVGYPPLFINHHPIGHNAGVSWGSGVQWNSAIKNMRPFASAGDFSKIQPGHQLAP